MKQILFPFLIALLLLASCKSENNTSVDNNEKDSIILPEPTIEYGFVLDSFQVIRDTVQKNWTLSHMLAPYGVSQYKH